MFDILGFLWLHHDSPQLEEGLIHQIASVRTVNTQHGQSTVVSLQREDGSCCTAWACGMLSTELLLNPMLLVNSRLFVVATGKNHTEESIILIN